jgi:hypothetical protein
MKKKLLRSLVIAGERGTERKREKGRERSREEREREREREESEGKMQRPKNVCDFDVQSVW